MAMSTVFNANMTEVQINLVFVLERAIVFCLFTVGFISGKYHMLLFILVNSMKEVTDDLVVRAGISVI